MNDIAHLSVLLIAIVIGYFMYRHYLRSGMGQLPPSAPFQTTFPTRDDYRNALDKWGKRGLPFQIPENLLPLHGSIIEVFSKYETVRLDAYTEVLGRGLLQKEYENRDFVQIGEWGDGSQVLVRCRSNDPQVYIEDIEECLPGNPRVLASCLEAYIRATVDQYEGPV